SEENPKKQLARQMMRMQNEINDKWLKGASAPGKKDAENRVTCGTCHRGKASPPPFEGKT
ncbi:MAG: photosynthetic reaction center cytochrome c subunit family protein, partial [Pseudonocardiaceae bacterium]